jgi:hypothetical protein
VAATWLLPPGTNRPKDFAVVKRDGHYHVFYIRHDDALADSDTEKDLGHAVSPDLYQWQHLDPVLPVRPGEWDSLHVWAPSIVERDGVYYMFYTGIGRGPGGAPIQRTGLAVSTDLMTWNRTAPPVFGCEQAPWAWCDPWAPTQAFRDPFVMADPLRPGRWLMYTTAYPGSDTTGMVVSLATSDGDFTSWSDAGPMWITHQSMSYNPVVESPHVMSRGDSLFYLFFSTWSGQPLSFATAADPAAPAPQWTYRGRLGTMLGVNTAAWFASEHLRDGLIDYFAFVDGDRLEFRRVAWQSDWRFYLAQPEPFHVQRMSWSTGSVRAGQPVRLEIAATFWYGQTILPEVLVVGADGTETPIEPWRMGFPASIPLTGGTTTITWTPAPAIDAPGHSEAAAIRVRLPNRTCQSPTLVVMPSWDPGGGEDPPLVGEVPGRGGRDPEDPAYPVLRRVSSPLAASAVLLESDAPVSARLEVFDLQGRRVRTLADRAFERGAHVLAWDGRDEHGRVLGRGVYFVRLVAAGATRTAKVVVH